MVILPSEMRQGISLTIGTPYKVHAMEERLDMETSESALDYLLLEIVESARLEDPEQSLLKLEQMGYRVGQTLAEKYSRDKARFNDTLEVIKFICKDFWISVFKKQVDHLKTNHRVSCLT